MIKSTFLTLLKLRLGSRTDTDLDVLISLEADQAQFELEHSAEIPWFLLGLETPITLVVGSRLASWPDGFLAEYEDGGIWVTDSSGNLGLLDKGDYDASLEYWGSETGLPKGYSTAGSNIQLFPIPDVAYTATVDCFLSDTLFSDLDGGEENLWLTHAPDVLIAKTGMRVATFIRDVELVQIFVGEYTLATKRMEIEHIARMEANRIRKMEG